VSCVTLTNFSSSFWPTFGLGLYGIRIVADYLKKRVYYRKGSIRIHLHHFLLGFPTTILSWVLFAINQDGVAWASAGFASALWASETKELILQKWER
jgi:hypothetical protein